MAAVTATAQAPSIIAQPQPFRPGVTGVWPAWPQQISPIGARRLPGRLGLVVTGTLFRGYPNLPEGHLAKLRAAVVNRTAQAGVARDLDLGAYVRLGRAPVHGPACAARAEASCIVPESTDRPDLRATVSHARRQ